MKVQFVFASLLLCSLLGGLFGEAVEESDYEGLENAESAGERRALQYNPGCDRETKGYPRLMGPKRHFRFSQRVQVPRYQPSYLPADGPNFNRERSGYPRYSEDSGFDAPSYEYPRLHKRFPSNKHRFVPSYGQGYRFPYKSVQSDAVLYSGPENVATRSGKVYMVRGTNGRELYRRALEAEEAEEEEMEEVQDY